VAAVVVVVPHLPEAVVQPLSLSVSAVAVAVAVMMTGLETLIRRHSPRTK
jgi:hypothetical protein